jgi:hypothetical protein
MQYAERLPNPRAMMVPVLALAIGAAAATGAYALLDEDGVNVEPTKVIVAEVPSTPSQGVAAKDEAATAAAIGSQTTVQSDSFSGKDEAATAAAVGSQFHGSSSSSTSFNGKDEATTAAAVGSQFHGPGSSTTSFNGKDEATTAAAVGNPYHLRGSKAAAPTQLSGAQP